MHLPMLQISPPDLEQARLLQEAVGHYVPEAAMASLFGWCAAFIRGYSAQPSAQEGTRSEADYEIAGRIVGVLYGVMPDELYGLRHAQEGTQDFAHLSELVLR